MEHFKKDEKAGILVFDLTKCLDYTEQIGRELHGESFGFKKDVSAMMTKFLLYIHASENQLQKFGINRKKGIFLTGRIGVGKTNIIRILSRYEPKINPRIILISAKQIAREFLKKGSEVIEYYGRSKALICIDDFGAEAKYKSNYYGSESNVIEDIIEMRYDLFIEEGYKTVVTTNLAPSEVKDFYNARVSSRAKEMFQIWSFPNDANDKRE